MSTSSRLGRLEKERRNTPRPLTTEEAVIAGTASLDEYAEVFADSIAKLQQHVISEAVGIVAVVHSPYPHPLVPKNALAYPPDRPLPEYWRDQLAYYERRASGPVETDDIAAHRRRDGFGVLNPPTRAEAAAVHLSMGGHEARGMRETVWRCDGGFWTVTPEVWMAAEHRKVGLHGSHYWNDVDGLFRAWTEGRIGDPEDRFATVSVAEIARFIGLPTIEATGLAP